MASSLLFLAQKMFEFARREEEGGEERKGVNLEKEGVWSCAQSKELGGQEDPHLG